MTSLFRQSAWSADNEPMEITGSGLRIQEQPARRKILLMGNASVLAEALAPDIELPRQPNTSTCVDTVGHCLWLRPRQWLLLPRCPAEPLLDRFTQQLQDRPACVADVSARFECVLIGGRQAAGLLNGGCSLDLRVSRFPAGRCAQSRIEQVPVIVFRSTEEDFEVIVERPLAHHLRRWLAEAAREYQE